MRRFFRSAVLAATCLTVGLAGCMTFDHTVGSGAQTHEKREEAQWFILWGLVPLNTVDSKSLAGGASNYHVRTQYTPLDVVISFFTGFVTIHKQTVMVEK
jgi:hypothetical protein